MPNQAGCKSGQYRYSDAVRSMAVLVWANAIATEVMDSIVNTRQWPKGGAAAHAIGQANSAAYLRVTTQFKESEWEANGLGCPGKTEQQRLHARAAFARQLQTWIMKMATTGGIHSTPGGAPDGRDWGLYARLVVVLMAGFMVGSQKHLFRSIGHATKLSADAAAIVTQLGKSHRTIWKNLCLYAPKLCMMQERHKKKRDPAKTQSCAKQILGMLPREWPSWVPRSLQPLGNWFWNPDNSKNQWFIDAFTIDPTGMLRKVTVIGMRGVAQEAVENPMANASIGSVPKIMVYIAVHAKYGIHLFYVNSGSTRGKVNAFKDFKNWTHDLNIFEQAYAAYFHHFNAIPALHAHPSFRPLYEDGPFQQPAWNSDLLLVR
jgi:hypothetical protein